MTHWVKGLRASSLSKRLISAWRWRSSHHGSKAGKKINVGDDTIYHITYIYTYIYIIYIYTAYVYSSWSKWNMTCGIIFPFLWVVSLKYPYSIANEEAHAQPLSECPRGWRSCSASDANPPPWHVATILPSMLQMQTKYTNPSEIKPGKLQKKYIVVLGEKTSNFIGDVLGMFEYRKDASKDSPCAELANWSCFPLVWYR